MNGAEFGIKKVKYLPVSGAFHSDLMLPAKSILQKTLKTIPVEAPLIPVYSNVDAKRYHTPDQIRTKLANQICEPVKWEQIMHAIFEREKGTEFPYTYECGPGTTLKTVLRMNNSLAHKKCSSVFPCERYRWPNNKSTSQAVSSVNCRKKIYISFARELCFL